MVDQCLTPEVAKELRRRGNEVTWSGEMYRGAPHDWLLQAARNEDRLLVTEANKYGVLVIRHGLDSHGVIIVDFNLLKGHAKEIKVAWLADLIDRFGGEFIGKLTKVMRGRVRQWTISGDRSQPSEHLLDAVVCCGKTKVEVSTTM